MQKHLFEYAVIRIVPVVEREEFLNAGVILYCAAQRFLQVSYCINAAKIYALSPTADLAEIEKRLEAFCQVSGGTIDGGPVARYPLASRFRWLTATRSTIVQTSPVHPGLCRDARETLDRLFAQLVS